MAARRWPLIVTDKDPKPMQVSGVREARSHRSHFHSSEAGLLVVSVDNFVAAVEGEGHEDPLVEVLDMAAGLVLLLGANNWVGVVRKPVQSFVVAVSGSVGIHSTYLLHSAYLQMTDIALHVVSGAAVAASLLTCQRLKNSWSAYDSWL